MSVQSLTAGTPWRRVGRRRFVSQGRLWVLVAPALVLYVGLGILPLIGVVLLSLTDASGLVLGAKWVGMENYSRLLEDPDFWRALKASAMFTGLSVPGTVVIGFLTALALDHGSRFASVVKAAVLVPFSMSLVVVGLYITFLSSSQLGLPRIIQPITGARIDMLGSPGGAMGTVVAGWAWIHLGLVTFLILAGLQAIPRELYEAARVDRAGPLARLVHITIPMLRETLIVVTVLHVISALRVFPLIFVSTNGGPNGATEVLGLYMYKRGFQSFEVGYGSAIAVVLFLIIAVVTFIQLGTTRSGTTQY